MKKDYTTPQIEVVRINMSATILVDSKATSVGGNIFNGGITGSNSGGRSREEDDWDDEW